MDPFVDVQHEAVEVDSLFMSVFHPGVKHIHEHGLPCANISIDIEAFGWGWRRRWCWSWFLLGSRASTFVSSCCDVGLFMFWKLTAVIFRVKPRWRWVQVHAVTVVLKDVLQLTQLPENFSLLSIFPQRARLNQAIIVSTEGTDICCRRGAGWCGWTACPPTGVTFSGADNWQSANYLRGQNSVS